MIVGDRLRELRAAKGFSQGHIEEKTGLLRCYISRVENGHTVPAVETLEKFARALEVPLYRLFHEGDVPANVTKSIAKLSASHAPVEDIPEMAELRKVLGKISERDRALLLRMAATMAQNGRTKRG